MGKKDRFDESEAESMNVMAIEHKGYKRLDFDSLNFSDLKEIDEDCLEEITPIPWVKEVLAGEKKVIIKRQ